MEENGKSPSHYDSFRGTFTELKQVRKLAKLNKLDESGSAQDDAFVQKISKKLELMMTSSMIKESEQGRKGESKKIESLKKTLEAKYSSARKEQGAMEEEVQPLVVTGQQKSDGTPTKSSDKNLGRLDPEFYRVLTADHTPNSKEDVQERPERMEQNLQQPVIIPEIKITDFSVPNQVVMVQSLETEATPARRSLVSPIVTSSAKEKNKRRESFSIHSVNSKSKAFQTFSSTLKNKENKQVHPTSRRSSTCPKPAAVVQRRKSMKIFENEDEAKNSVTKAKSMRKSMIPESFASLEDIQSENKQLKRDLERKNREIDNLKREKQALVRKVKALGTEMIDESKTNLEGNTRIYCRVKPLMGEMNNMIDYPELQGGKSPMKQEVQLRCLRISHQDKKSLYCFDRVFSHIETQAEVY